jgi:hypothetical protein
MAKQEDELTKRTQALTAIVAELVKLPAADRVVVLEAAASIIGTAPAEPKPSRPPPLSGGLIR